MVQWLRLCISTARGTGLIPGWGTKVPHAARRSQNKQTDIRVPAACNASAQFDPTTHGPGMLDTCLYLWELEPYRDSTSLFWGCLWPRLPGKRQLRAAHFCFHLAITGREGLQAVLDSSAILQVSAHANLEGAKYNYGNRNGSGQAKSWLLLLQNKQTKGLTKWDKLILVPEAGFLQYINIGCNFFLIYILFFFFFFNMVRFS